MLVALLLIYGIGKKFYELAFNYERSQWGYAIAGVASYYAGTFVSVLIIAVILEIYNPGYVESNEGWLGVLGIPFGILACWGLYKILENSWSKSKASSQPDTLDGGMIR